MGQQTSAAQDTRGYSSYACYSAEASAATNKLADVVVQSAPLPPGARGDGARGLASGGCCWSAPSESAPGAAEEAQWPGSQQAAAGPFGICCFSDIDGEPTAAVPSERDGSDEALPSGQVVRALRSGPLPALQSGRQAKNARWSAACASGQRPGQDSSDEEDDKPLHRRSAGEVAEAEGPGAASPYRSRAALAALLEGGDIALVRGSWLAAHAAEGSECEGGLAAGVGGGGGAYSAKAPVLPRRQALPARAFCRADLVLTSPIIAISHCWWDPSHPDPRGEQLRVLGAALKHRLAWGSGEVLGTGTPGAAAAAAAAPAPGSRLKSKGAVAAKAGGGEVAVFIDWCSMHQAPRSEKEERAFRRALEKLGVVFAHEAVSLWMLTKVPWGARNFADRGWPAFEWAVSQLQASGREALDLNRLSPAEPCKDWPALARTCTVAAKQKPPLAPDAFSRQLCHKIFRVGADHDVVLRVYRSTFHDAVASASRLDYSGLAWADREAACMAAVLPECSSLKELILSENLISDSGMKRIAESMPLCPRLRRLSLNSNEVGDAGAARLADVLPRCHQLHALDLAGNLVGDAGASRLAAVLPRCGRLQELLLGQNFLSDPSASLLAGALPSCASLRELDLQENEIGDLGAAALAAAAPQCRRLQRFSLARNRVGDAGARALAEAIPRCRRLQAFGVGGNEVGEILGGERIGDGGAASLASALQRCARLRSLDLGENQIGDRGAARLADALPEMASLAELHLGRNLIAAAGALRLLEVLPRCRRLERLHLVGNVPPARVRSG